MLLMHSFGPELITRHLHTSLAVGELRVAQPHRGVSHGALREVGFILASRINSEDIL